HQLLEAAHFRAAELVDLTVFGAALDGRNDGVGDVAGEDRLEPGMAAPDQRRAGEKRAIAANLLKKSSSGPNRTEGRRMMADGTAASTSFSPTAFERA